MHVHRQAFFKFPLDPFQEEACRAIDAGENVLVCAPTGAGKTAVAEWAMMAALSARKRCLYTTPLKALSNQKFFDLCQLFGESHVGLSTGDVSLRGEADLVVMTTEVYRNMLYGTSPDLKDAPSIARVASVILDECHYMNDLDRGTVWEESIVYSPREIQLIGLSATVANAHEMRDWLESIHGPTRLISTDFRPVPLRHYYFRKGELLDVFAQKGTNKKQVNPRLWRFKDERSPKRRAGVPFARSLCDSKELLSRLERQDMLPVIYFVFSRKGCEQLLEETLGVVSLTADEREAIDRAIATRSVQSPEILEHPHLEYLRRGTAVHHAGVLPLWKSLVEQLFAQGLVKVVFATETLAAGINMPARTTVISALSKFTGEGLRPLTGSEMLQMSGRAGRRGMDKAGNVVICAHPKEPVEMVAHLARARPEALESHFQPSYGMVLNLLQRRPMEQVKELLDRSFGQFLHRQQQRRDGLAAERLGEDFSPPCPEEPGDRTAYLKLLGRRRSVKKGMRDLKRGAGPEGGGRELKAAVRDLGRESTELEQQLERSPCNACPNYEPCGELYQQLRESEKPSYWEDFQAQAAVLTDAGLLEDDVPTPDGRLLAHLRASNVFAVGEALLGPVLDYADEIDEPIFAAICCLLVSETVRRDPRLPAPPDYSRRTAPHLKRILLLFEDLEEQQLEFGVDRELPCETLFCGVAELWGGGLSWEALEGASSLPGGDLFRILRRTYDLCRQVENWIGAPPELVELAEATSLKLHRGPLQENMSFLELVEGDPEEQAEEALAAQSQLPALAPLGDERGASTEDPPAEGVRRRIVRRRPPSGVRGKSGSKKQNSKKDGFRGRRR